MLQRASGHEIERLPTYTYQSSPAKDQQHRRDATSNEGDGETDDPEKELKRKCSICLDYFENGQQLRILPCLHQFHSGCVDRWLSRGKAECPVCKVDIRNQWKRGSYFYWSKKQYPHWSTFHANYWSHYCEWILLLCRFIFGGFMYNILGCIGLCRYPVPMESFWSLKSYWCVFTTFEP